MRQDVKVPLGTNEQVVTQLPVSKTLGYIFYCMVGGLLLIQLSSLRSDTAGYFFSIGIFFDSILFAVCIFLGFYVNSRKYIMTNERIIKYNNLTPKSYHAILLDKVTRYSEYTSRGKYGNRNSKTVTLTYTNDAGSLGHFRLNGIKVDADIQLQDMLKAKGIEIGVRSF